MKRVAFCCGLVALSLGCSKTTDGASPAASSSAVPAPSQAALGTVKAPTIAPPTDAFGLGYCELSVDGGPAKKFPGGPMAFSTRHWAAEGPMKAKIQPLFINCGNVDLSPGSTNEAEYPMKAGKFPIRSTDAPRTMVTSTIGNAKGELTIEAWEKSSIRGSFIVEGMSNGKLAKYNGKFDYKCPPSLACK